MVARSPATRLCTAVLVAASFLAAACGDRQVDIEPSIGQVERNETVTAANLAIVTDGAGVGVLVGTLINEGERPDHLVDVDVEGEQLRPVQVVLLDGPVLLPPEEPVRLADGPSVVVSTQRLVEGLRVPVELTFEDSAPLAFTVTVEPQSGPYADLEVPPAG